MIKERDQLKWDIRYDKGKGSIKILSTQVGGASSELGWCIWMCISYVCLHGTSIKFKHPCLCDEC